MSSNSTEKESRSITPAEIALGHRFTRKRGGQRKPDAEKRSEHLTVLMTPWQMETLKAIAFVRGKTPSRCLSDLLPLAIQSLPAGEAEIINRLIALRKSQAGSDGLQPMETNDE